MRLLFTLLVLTTFSANAQELALWLRYPAISPDGQTIAFSYQGDLFTVSSSGGEAKRLTVHSAYDYQPVWSHDGKTIAFASNRHGNFDVFTIPAAGGTETRLTYNSAQDFPSDFTIDDTKVLFSSARIDSESNRQNPSRALPELYLAPTTPGRIERVLTIPAIDARYSADGSKIIFHDQKGYEDSFRKHHTSSVARDLWQYDIKSGEYKQLTDMVFEERTPHYLGDGKIAYLSEGDGTFNIYQMDLTGGRTTQLTTYKDHPLRSLTVANDGTMCYSWNGELYIYNGQAKKLEVTVAKGERENRVKLEMVEGISEYALSPSGKEIAFIYHGEVFVASVKGGVTKRITDTPEQERGIEFSPDGKSLLYAGERDGSWNLYQTTLSRKEEPYFFSSTILEEKPLLKIPAETFQASYSPDGKEVAFLEERTALKVVNIATGKVREIVPGSKNYSYADGDQYYQWSPDGKWFLVGYLPHEQWIDQAGLVSSQGGEVVNLSKSGYGVYGPSWEMDGKMIIWYSARDGQKNHGSWGGEMDVYGLLLTEEAWDEFRMSEDEYALFKETKEKEKSEEEAKKDDKKGKKGDKEKKEDAVELPEVKIQLEGLKDRMRKLTIHSSDLGGAVVSKDGTNLYYLSSFEKGFDLWVTNLRSQETKILAKLGNGANDLRWSKDGAALWILADGAAMSVNPESGEVTPVAVSGSIELDEQAERAYLFEHIWRQVDKKFYVEDLHGVDWKMYKAAYSRFLPHITDNYDFAEMCSEMLGELNASHTGAFYRAQMEGGDETSSFGAFYDETFTGDGLKISEIMAKSPLIQDGTKIKVGVIIEKIDGEAIVADKNYFQMLNRKAGVNTLLSLHNPATKERWEEVVRPISGGQESQLLYKRWVDNCRKIVDEASGGKVGYVHVRGMDDYSYRVVYEEVLGQSITKDALIVDTRFNGGGWLHDDLATFLSGKEYITFFPRGQKLGHEPQVKWTKPSAVVMNESNYSDAHMFPYTYRALGIGKLVGMPVAGTGTAVWWEGLMNGVVFGIPQVGMIDIDGDYLENKQLEPDLKVENQYSIVTKGRDQQLEEAVKLLMK
jgi:tricorn protease